MSDDNRPFPIQGEPGYVGNPDKGQPGFIPWWLAELAYQEYSKQFGTSQSLQKLADRGGFGRKELIFLIRGEWR